MDDDIVQRIRDRIHDAPLPTEYMLDDAATEIQRLRIELYAAKGHQRVSIVDQDGNEVGHGFRSMKELTTEEAHVDEFGTVWTRPTAWAYFAACRATRALRNSAEAA